MSAVVGIDLGTSNSAVATLIEGKHQVIPDESGNRLTPSVVSVGKDQRILVGSDARTQLFSNPKRTIASIKRLIGRKIFSPEVAKAQALLPYEIIEAEDQNVAIKIDDHLYSPQDVSSYILRHMKDVAEKYLKTSLSEAVITVPAYFNDNQRQATKDAAKIAGLEVLRMINEPTAAALAYGFGKGLNETVAVYDLGGGTFDISILRLKDKVFEVIASAGDTFLGGDDFDDRIIDLVAQAFLKRTGIDLRTVPAALPLLRMNAEKAKRKLSYAEKTDIYIPSIVQQNSQALDLQVSLTRPEFRQAADDLIQRTFSVCDEAIRTAGIRTSEIDAIILVGGPTKMSIVFEAVASYFGRAPLRDINPDEVVAVGASIQAHTLKGTQTKSKALLLDVTPLDLGIATVDGFVETIIEGNSPIPSTAARVFTTTRDNQSSVLIRIFQGKNRREEESTALGEFEFSGFKKAKAGQVSIVVEFSINTDGIMEVSAKDKETGAVQQMSVRLTTAMSSERLDSKKQESENVKEVRLKNEWADATKVVACLPHKGGAAYEEGFVRQFDPLQQEWSFLSDNSKTPPKTVERSKALWVLTLEDFANTSRYLQAVSDKPVTIQNPLVAPIHCFELKDGSKIYAQAKEPDLKKEGFWVQPYFPRDDLPGKIFIYSAMVKEIVLLA